MLKKLFIFFIATPDPPRPLRAYATVAHLARLSAWGTQKRRSSGKPLATLCPGIEPRTFRTDNMSAIN